MGYKSVCISSGHGLFVRGAAGFLDEVECARDVVEAVAINLRQRGVAVTTFHDDTSQSVDKNLQTIVDYHNAQSRELDVSVHLNAYVETTEPRGTEVLYVSQDTLADRLSEAIAGAGGFIDRGPKYNGDLYFLNHTKKPAVLLEICFVDSEADSAAYIARFDELCDAIADELGGEHELDKPTPFAVFKGPASTFGGPADEGVAPDEGLAFIYDVADAPHLFLPVRPPGTTGLARRLNPSVHYVACRWDYSQNPKETLLEGRALVRARKTGIALAAYPADWGPHEDTGRAADLSPGLMADLGIETDDEVVVVFPIPERAKARLEF